jgi:autotransporter-associated beta strand protein
MKPLSPRITVRTVLCLVLTFTHLTYAGSATWNLNPTNGDWNTPANWTPATVPNGDGDDATFAVTSQANISLFVPVLLNQIIFNPGASAYTISFSNTSSSTITGGIINNSGINEDFVTVAAPDSGRIFLSGPFTVGGNVTFTNQGQSNGNVGGQLVVNAPGADLGRSTVINLPGGVTTFWSGGSAGHATITNQGGTRSGIGRGSTSFLSIDDNEPTAANATFINYGSNVRGGLGGSTSFHGSMSAANSTLIAYGGQNGGHGGTIEFDLKSKGGAARVKVYDNGSLDISGHNQGAVGVGSLEGTGQVFLGGNSLRVGSNNHTTSFSGLIQDGGIFGGTGGSLVKTGTNNLTLAGLNAYTGGTTINGGRLLVVTSLATGSGPVQVNAGTLLAIGTLTGPVTCGKGNGMGAFLDAETSQPFTIQKALTFNADGTYDCEIDSDTQATDFVIAEGITINSGAQIALSDLGTSTLPAGTIITVLSNSGATSTAGAFSNLPDGSAVAIGNNTFQANYEGGDGNDLTLTVVP